MRAASPPPPGKRRRRATVALGEGRRYEGQVDAAGRRHGRGTLVVADDEGQDVFWVTGSWACDELHGPATASAADGSAVEGRYAAGELAGPVVERFPGGRTKFAGEYRGGVRHGWGLEALPDGGALEGPFVGGVLHGAAVYHFPSGAGEALVGRFVAGELRSEGRYVADPAVLAALLGEEPAAGGGGEDDLASGDKRHGGGGPGVVRSPAAARRLRRLEAGGSLGAAPASAAAWRRALRAGGDERRRTNGKGDGSGDPHEAAGLEMRAESAVAGWTAGVFVRAGKPVGPGALLGFAAAGCLGGQCARGAAPNAAFEPAWHPVHGDTLALRATAALSGGAEVVVPYLYLDPNPSRVEAGLALRREEGYYCHLALTPPKERLAEAESRAGFGDVHVEGHGPWRVLYFNAVEQGIAYVDEDVGQDEDSEAADREAAADPFVIGFEYQLLMARLAAALGGGGEGERLFLCVGLGAGSVSAYLAEGLGERAVVLEVDAAVVDLAGVLGRRVERLAADALAAGAVAWDADADAAGSEGQGRRGRRRRSARCCVGDARAWLERYCAALEGRDGGNAPERPTHVLLDAYDGEGNVPAHLQAEAFVALCGRVLAAGGALVANLWNGPPGTRAHAEARRFAAAVRRHVGPAFLCPVPHQDSNAVLVARKGGVGGPAALRAALLAGGGAAAGPGRDGDDPFVRAYFEAAVAGLRACERGGGGE